MQTFAHLIQSASSLPTEASALESAISALERDIKTLENSSLPLEHALPWFTGVVALGVAMELWVVWHDRREDMNAWRRGVICWPPDRPSLTKYIVEILSVLLVTGGIVGELWAGVKITEINGSLRTKSAELRSKSDQLLALVTQKAGDAQTSAEGAARAASRAQSSADIAAIKAGSAGDLAVRVNDEAEVLTKRTAELQAQGVSLQKLINSGKDDLAVLKMSRQIQNTPEWIQSLKAYAGTEYAFSDVFADAESIRFLLFIDELLQAAGWKRVPLPPAEMVGVIALNPFGDCPKCFVPLSARDGLIVAIQEPSPPAKPEMTPVTSEYQAAAGILWKEVFSTVFPRDGTTGSQWLITTKGDSHIVRIGVGSKPEPTEPYDPKEWQKIIEKMRQQRSQPTKP